MKKLLIPIVLILNIVSAMAAVNAADSAALRRMAQFAGNMLTYNNHFTQEKVYLHLDNNGYIAGERLWFKAYVFKASSLLPTDLSKVLYVELLNPDGELIERKTLRVDNGRTYGDFEIDPIICHAGYYEVRAYTRAMLNWDQSYIYSRVLPIYAPPADSVNLTGLQIPHHEYANSKKAAARHAPQSLADAGTRSAKDMMLTFYPEGGHITRNLPADVAYKLTDRDGLPIDRELTLYTADGRQVATSRAVHDGMGHFVLPADWQDGYAAVKTGDGQEVHFPLPESRPEGCDLHAVCSRQQGLRIAIRSTAAMQGKALGISVTCRGTLCYFNTVTTDSLNLISIPYAKLRDGIAQVTLFTDMGEVLSERLVWVEPHRAAPKMEIRQNQKVYHPFQPVVLDISLRDSEGQPLQADFSLSVRDAATETGPDPCGIATDMLLSSELKGYIHQPEYYFEADDDQHRQALDLLLMVQGWRRYRWQEMSGVDPFVLKQPAEEGLTLIGNLSSTHSAEHQLAREGSLDINFLMQTIEGSKIFDVQTDSTGYFAVQLPDFNHDAPSVMTVTNRKDKRVYTHFKLNRNFSPPVVPYEPLQLATATSITDSRTIALARRPATFEWKDTIPDHVSRLIQLKEVKITGQKQLGYNPGARFTWMGGENATKGKANRFYNLRDELDRYLDDGEEVPVVWDWLLKRDRNFVYDRESGEMWYKGRRVLIVRNNRYRSASVRMAYSSEYPDFMNVYQSLSIVEDEETASNIIGQMWRSPIENTPSARVVFFLYTRPDRALPNEYKRGTRWINLHGYSLCTEFYSPDYRRQDIPTDTDHRRTLYWNPSLVTNTEGKASVIFYSGSRPDERLHINAQGIAVNGQMIEGK